MAARDAITAEYVRSILDYNPETGALIWRYRPEHLFAGEGWRRAAAAKSWNTKFAGSPAYADDCKGYFVTTINNKQFRTHRVIWLIQTGEWPAHLIDHEDRNGQNNKWSNIRDATKSQNACNSKTRVDSSTGLKGAFPSRSGKFVAAIRIAGRKKHIGTYDTADAAHAAYVRAAQQHHGRFAREG